MGSEREDMASRSQPGADAQTRSHDAPRSGEGVLCEFWLVWTKTGRPPRCRHNTRETAVAEAQRLAATHPEKTFIVMRGEEKFRTSAPMPDDEPHRHPVRVVIEGLTDALRVARTAITYAAPPKDFGTPDDPNPCYEARVPVAFVEQIDRALSKATGEPT